jgi:hypothetical protein
MATPFSSSQFKCGRSWFSGSQFGGHNKLSQALRQTRTHFYHYSRLAHTIVDYRVFHIQRIYYYFSPVRLTVFGGSQASTSLPDQLLYPTPRSLPPAGVSLAGLPHVHARVVILVGSDPDDSSLLFSREGFHSRPTYGS